MKKLLAVVLTILLSSVAGTAAGAGRQSRKVTLAYEHPAVALGIGTPMGTHTGAGYCDPETAPPPANQGCLRLKIRGSDRSVDIEIKDAHGLPVQGWLVDATGRVMSTVCGATESSIDLGYTPYVDLWLVAGTCAGGTWPSVPTIGTITATFHR